MQTATATATTSKTTSKKSASKKPAAAFNAPIAEVHLVPIELIDVLVQIRTEFDQESIEELARDIELRGLMQPVLLNPNGGRFTMIAGERRLRAIQFNGQSAIPALITKVSKQEAMLMQLAENVQREELSIDDECKAICKLYEALGSLKEVAAKVKKSVPWCSKRYAMTQQKLHYVAKMLLEDGHSEDIELLKALSDLANLVGWTAGNEWANKVREGKAKRDEIREALKIAKKDYKAKEEKAATNPNKVSHAKPKEPPPPPPWNIEEAMDELDEALNYCDGLSALDIFNSYTEEQRKEINSRIQGKVREGMSEGGYAQIRNYVFNPFYETKIYSLEAMAIIAGYTTSKFDLEKKLVELQESKENA